MIKLDGREVARQVRKSVKARVEALQSATGRSPQLAVILVGEHTASAIYVRNKQEACQRVGIRSRLIRLEQTTSQQELLGVIKQLGQDQDVDGILVQLPLPDHIQADVIIEAVPVAKDVDGFTATSLGQLVVGQSKVAACTPHGIMRILSHYNLSVAGKKVVVIGRSRIVGKPMSLMLLQANATVTICHSQTQDLESITRQADVVIVAAGKARFLGREAFKKDSVVIDVGMHGSGQGQLCGDVRFEELENWVKAASPVPGGVGPMTIASLLENVCTLAEAKK